MTILTIDRDFIPSITDKIERLDTDHQYADLIARSRTFMRRYRETEAKNVLIDDLFDALDSLQN